MTESAKTFTTGVHLVAATQRGLDTNLTQPANAPSFDGALAVTLKAASANAGVVYIGPTGVTGITDGYPLAAGASLDIVASELGNLFSIGTAGDKIAMIGAFEG